MRIYFENGFTSSEFAEVPTSEVLSPLVMMLVLGILHSQIVGTKSSKRKHNFGENYSSRSNNNKRLKWIDEDDDDGDHKEWDVWSSIKCVKNQFNS